jgi:hypothetical protein
MNENKHKTHMGSTLILLQHYEEHGKAFISRNVRGDETWVLHYTPDSKAESMNKPLQKTALSPGKGAVIIFCEIYGVLLVDFKPHSSTINAAPYQETLKETLGGSSSKETRMPIKVLLHNKAGPHSTAVMVDLLTS